MTTNICRASMLIGVLMCMSFAPLRSGPITFDRIVVFGASISDPGNAFALLGEAIEPPYQELDTFLLPDAPYATGGYHFSNGATWIEQYAKPRGLGNYVAAAFNEKNSHAMNYAVGGARARNDGFNFNLRDQVSAFLNDVGNVAPSHALYVIDIGANDVRDALVTGDASILEDALKAIGANMAALYAAGAKQFLVLNVPDLGVLPALRIADDLCNHSCGAGFFGGVLSRIFNFNLENGVLADIGSQPGVKIARLNLRQIVNDVMNNPAAFGLTETEAPCIGSNVAPSTCEKPDQFFFWDGIHPTKAMHGILAQQAAVALGQ